VSLIRRGRERRDEPADIGHGIELTERLDRDEVEQEPDERGGNEDEHQDDQDRDAAIEHPRVHPPAQVSADDHERSLREVDDTRRGEDQAVSDGDERVDRTDRQRVLDRLNGLVHGFVVSGSCTRRSS
jgi:hypothetical protein